MELFNPNILKNFYPLDSQKKYYNEAGSKTLYKKASKWDSEGRLTEKMCELYEADDKTDFNTILPYLNETEYNEYFKKQIERLERKIHSVRNFRI
ncbi:MAG: hypothetical protein HUK25_08310 [Treponema sp.]|nr:hypothetical protein [Treponema sp.]